MLALVAAARAEPDYVVWGAVSSGLGSLLGTVEEEGMRQRLEEFGRWLVQPNLARLGWEAKKDDSPFDTLMRPMVLRQAVRFDDPATVAEAKHRFQQWESGRELDPNLLGV